MGVCLFREIFRIIVLLFEKMSILVSNIKHSWIRKDTSYISRVDYTKWLA